jgi:hypothetical protein
MTKQKLKIKATNYGLFDGINNITIPSLRLFYGYFEKLACDITIEGINRNKVRNWVEATLKDSILNKHYGMELYEGKNQLSFSSCFFILKNEILITISINGDCFILFNHENEAIAKEYADSIKKLRTRKSKVANFFVIVPRLSGIGLHSMKNIDPKVNLSVNYNNDIKPIHERICKKLKTKEGSGLVLLYGQPGTGKSTYIRHLIHVLKKLTIIFLSPVMFDNYKSRELTTLLIDNPNSILVIEDAEELLVERDGNYNSGISMLLNLTDGLLGKSLNVKVICTFNTQISKIDKALLRKGRLIAAYDFKPLCIEKAKALLDVKGVKDYSVTEPMTLAELFNISEQGFSFEPVERKQIGFMAEVA